MFRAAIPATAIPLQLAEEEVARFKGINNLQAIRALGVSDEFARFVGYLLQQSSGTRAYLFEHNPPNYRRVILRSKDHTILVHCYNPTNENQLISASNVRGLHNDKESEDLYRGILLTTGLIDLDGERELDRLSSRFERIDLLDATGLVELTRSAATRTAPEPEPPTPATNVPVPPAPILTTAPSLETQPLVLTPAERSEFQEIMNLDQFRDWRHQNGRYDGIKFERFIGYLFQEDGYTVSTTPTSNDGGVDLVLDDNGRRILVQCKCHNNRISVNDVRNFGGAALLYNSDDNFFITNSEFVTGAYEYAEQTGIKLYDGASLADWFQRINRPYQPQRVVETVVRPVQAEAVQQQRAALSPADQLFAWLRTLLLHPLFWLGLGALTVLSACSAVLFTGFLRPALQINEPTAVPAVIGVGATATAIPLVPLEIVTIPPEAIVADPYPPPLPTDTPQPQPTATPAPTATPTFDYPDPKYRVRRMPQGFVADGDLGDWGDIESISADIQIYCAPGANPEDDINTRWRLAWDESYLYVAAIVDDDAHKPYSDYGNAHLGDSIEVWIGPLRNDGTDINTFNLEHSIVTFVTHQNGVMGYGHQRDPGELNGQRRVILEPNMIMSGDASARTEPSGDGNLSQRTTYEARIPWEKIRLTPTQNKFRIALNARDNDTGLVREEILYSNKEGSSWELPHTWSAIMLVD